MIPIVPVELADPALTAAVGSGLLQVEQALAESAQAPQGLLTEASRHLIQAGGKRFRAMLVLLAAQFGNPADERVIQAATAIELTHLATLFHDDVQDGALIRRGHESANARWGNTVAILTGDFLFSQASQILAVLGVEAVQIQAETVARLVGGQIAETIEPQPGEDPLDHYLKVVEDKTASLMATAGRFGVMFSGAPPELAAHVAVACHALGVAFQLSDDILDVTSDSDQLGKAPGTDLREGVRSLPVLHALRASSGRLYELLTSDGLADEALLAEALGLLRADPALDAARADLRRWADAARAEVAGLPPVPARAAFDGMCDFVVRRTG